MSNQAEEAFDLSIRDHCLFCFRETRGDVCGRQECIAYYRDHVRDWAIGERRERHRALWAVLRVRAKSESDWTLSRPARWFYTVKFLICEYVLGGGWYPEGQSYPDAIDVAQYNYQKLYAGWSVDIAKVGHGVLTGWWSLLTDDGDWYI